VLGLLGQMDPHRTATGKRAMGAGLALGIAAIAALVAAPSHAQAGWCATAFVNCGYATWPQCRAAVSGQGGICYANRGDNLLRPAGTITLCRPTETAGRSVGIGTLTLFTWFSLISDLLAQSVT
jgi:hypothetical protein